MRKPPSTPRPRDALEVSGRGRSVVGHDISTPQSQSQIGAEDVLSVHATEVRLRGRRLFNVWKQTHGAITLIEMLERRVAEQQMQLTEAQQIVQHYQAWAHREQPQFNVVLLRARDLNVEVNQQSVT